MHSPPGCARATAARRVLGVGHRVVHGGARYAGPTIVTPEVLEDLRALVPLAPLHQPYNLAAIDAVVGAAARRAAGRLLRHELPSRPAGGRRARAAAARDLRAPGVQRYGFHGLSYEYIASVLPTVAPEIADGRVIVAHLGSGASMCAMNDGKSVDSTLGFTALDGLCMGTRPGALDPGVILYLFQDLGLSAKEVETILYKKSGLLGISGISNDMRDLLEQQRARRHGWPSTTSSTARPRRSARSPRCWAASTALVFTAGIGENSAEIRRRICEASAWLGVELDAKANASKRPANLAPRTAACRRG